MSFVKKRIIKAKDRSLIYAGIKAEVLVSQRNFETLFCCFSSNDGVYDY